jgi:hypothetical protein
MSLLEHGAHRSFTGNRHLHRPTIPMSLPLLILQPTASSMPRPWDSLSWECQSRVRRSACC